MNGLIKVDFTNDRPTVLGRELHKMLEVTTPYHIWFPRMCEYGFGENIDYVSFEQNCTKPQGGRPATDHQLTIEMAKEIAMLQRTEKGKQVRQYFIQLEKDWNTPEKIMARALNIANRSLEDFKARTYELEAKIEEQKPKVEFAEHVAAANNTMLVREVAKLASKEGIKIGEKRLYEKLRAWGLIFKNSCEATQKAIEQGLFEVTEGVRESSKGKFIYKTTRVTGKGQIYIINRLKKELN